MVSNECFPYFLMEGTDSTLPYKVEVAYFPFWAQKGHLQVSGLVRALQSQFLVSSKCFFIVLIDGTDTCLICRFYVHIIKCLLGLTTILYMATAVQIQCCMGMDHIMVLYGSMGRKFIPNIAHTGKLHV
jgi:hypothetical protein